MRARSSMNQLAHFMDWLGLVSKITLSLVVFAKLGCAVLVVVGLFTKLTLIPIIINMLVVFL
jgi:putative oxidoreductase